MRASQIKIWNYPALSLLMLAATLAPVNAQADVTPESSPPSIYEIRSNIPYPNFKIFAEGGEMLPLKETGKEEAAPHAGDIHVTATGATMEFDHTRQDCRVNASGATLCNTWKVREVKILNLDTGPNAAPSASTIYYIHNTKTGSWEIISNQPNAGYNPPGELTLSYNDKG